MNGCYEFIVMLGEDIKIIVQHKKTLLAGS
jgi:hypothetical protein